MSSVVASGAGRSGAPVGVVVNLKKDSGFAVTRSLVGVIRSLGGTVVLSDGGEGGFADGRPIWPKELADAAESGEKRLLECSAWVCVGGDGTMIRASKAAAKAGIPIVGVNKGTLGYLAEVEVADCARLAGRLLSGDYGVEERMMIETPGAESCGGTAKGAIAEGAESCVGTAGVAKYTALNEVSVNRSGASSRVISIDLYVNGKLIDVFSGDGILISTPTGSTAYAFSAGGPIVDPDLELFLVVPICPHMVLPKPLLVEPGKTITLVPRAAGARFRASVAVDGTPVGRLSEGMSVSVRRAARPARIIRFVEDSFYATLRRKLYSRGEVARREESRATQ